MNHIVESNDSFYVFCADIVFQDLEKIEKNLNRIRELDKQKDIDENTHKKYRYFQEMNWKAREEISVFLAYKFHSFLEENRSICLSDNNENLIFAIRTNYKFGLYKKYYDPEYDFSTEAKWRAFPIPLQDQEKRITEAIELKATDPMEYYKTIRKIIEDNQILFKCSKLIECHNILSRRREIFVTLIDLYQKKCWQSFIALASLQIEGLFYDCCEIIKAKDLGGTAGSFTEKVEKAFRDNEIMMLQVYPYFMYDVPLIRNMVAHVGTLEINDHKAEDLVADMILDLNALVEWNYRLSRVKYTIISMIYDELQRKHRSDSNQLLCSMLSCTTVSDYKYIKLIKRPSDYESEMVCMKCDIQYWKTRIQFIRNIIDTEEFWKEIEDHIDENAVIEKRPFNLPMLAKVLCDEFITEYPDGSVIKRACVGVMDKLNKM